MKAILKVFLLGASFLAFASAAAMAQTKASGKIKGTVATSAGKVLPGARVVASSKKTNADVSAVTGRMGHFAFRDLPAGTYSIRISDAGYKPKVQPMVTVMAGQTTQDRVMLKKAGTPGA